MVPPQLARKMSVLSVDPPAPWAPGQIAAGRAHRPGSRRLGGVEAPGASPATGASWPDRRKGWASPGRGPVLPISRGGCVDSGPGALSSLPSLTRRWGRYLSCPAHEATATRATIAAYSRTVLLKKKFSWIPAAMPPRLPRVNRLQIGRPPSRGRRATWRRRSGGGRASTAEGRVREMKSPTDASSICEARISPVATASGDFL